MGCFWSNEAEERERYSAYQHRVVDSSSYGIQLRPRFGLYRCVCGHRWNSRRSWKNKYLICNICKRKVLAHTQRDLRPSDMVRLRANIPEHPQNKCQMCLELGYYCGRYKI